MADCDYCGEGIPVVCGECGAEVALSRHGYHHMGLGHLSDHRKPIRLVHRIPDPEGIEGTAVVPCGRVG